MDSTGNASSALEAIFPFDLAGEFTVVRVLKEGERGLLTAHTRKEALKRSKSDGVYFFCHRDAFIYVGLKIFLIRRPSITAS